MAAEANFKVNWKVDMSALRRMWWEQDRRNKLQLSDTIKARQTTDKTIKEELKSFKTLSKTKDTLRDSEFKKSQKLAKETAKTQKESIKTDLQHHRRKNQERDRELGHLRRMDVYIRRMSRGSGAGGGGRPPGDKKDKGEPKPGDGGTSWFRPEQGFFRQGIKSIVGIAAGTAAFAAGGISALFIGSALKGYQAFLGAQQALSPGIGLGQGKLLNQAFRARGTQLGYNVTEVSQMGTMAARSTGFGGAAGARAVMTANRATGLEPGEAADMLGAIRQGIMRPEGKKTILDLSVKEFERLQASANFSGLDKARFPEFATGITQFIKAAGMTQVGGVSGQGVGALAGMMGRAGGMQGTRALNLLQRVSQGMQSPGGGEEGMAFIRQALGYGLPGSTMGLGDVEHIRERGLMQKTPEETIKVFNQLMQGLGRQVGPNKTAQEIAGRDVLGVSMDQMSELIDLYKSGATGEDAYKQLKEIQEKNLSLEDQAYNAMKESATSLGFIAKKFDHDIEIGGKSFGVLSAIENAQQKFVDWMFREFPKLVEMFKQFWEDFKTGLNALIEGLSFGILKGPFETKEERARNERLEQAFGTAEMQAARRRLWDRDAKRRSGEMQEAVPSWYTKNDEKSLSVRDRLTGNLPPEMEKKIISKFGAGSLPGYKQDLRDREIAEHGITRREKSELSLFSIVSGTLKDINNNIKTGNQQRKQVQVTVADPGHSAPAGSGTSLIHTQRADSTGKQ